MSVKFSGVKMTFQGNVLYCAQHKELQDNIDICVKALCTLVGLDEKELFDHSPFESSFFEDNGGKVEFYRSRG